MERSKVIRSLAFWASGAVLVVIGLFLYLKNPFDVPFNNLLIALLIWPIIFVIMDFLFRKNEFYRKIMLIVKPFILIISYFSLLICKYLISNY